jgi:thioredoxin-like negative regulator of GroEL
VYCRQQKPIVNGLEREYDGLLRVRHVNVDDPRNRNLVAEYQASSIPLLIIFDKRGNVVATYRGLTRASVLMEGIDKALAAE